MQKNKKIFVVILVFVFFLSNGFAEAGLLRDMSFMSPSNEDKDTKTETPEPVVTIDSPKSSSQTNSEDQAQTPEATKKTKIDLPGVTKTQTPKQSVAVEEPEEKQDKKIIQAKGETKQEKKEEVKEDLKQETKEEILVVEKDTTKMQVTDMEPAAGEDLTLLERLAKKVSLDLRGMDIVEVFKFLAKQVGLNIAVSKDVKGRITLVLNNVPVQDILDVILLTNGLAFEKKEDILTVITDSEYEALHGEKFSDKREIKTVKLKYASASMASEVLSNMKSSIGKVISNEETGTLILMDTPEKIKELESAALGLDIPTITRQLPTATEVFELGYAKAVDIEPQIQEALTKDIGEVRVDERTNKVIVTDLDHNMPKLAKLIKEFDVKTREVFIEAKIMEITLSDDYYAGIEWSAIFSQIHNLTFTNTFPFGATGSSDMEITMGTLDTDNYEGTINFLKGIGDVKIISTPQIIVSDNSEAKFMVGSREAYVTTSTTAAGTTSTVSESVEFIDVGVSLYVKPFINKDGFIKMDIKPEVSSVREWFETSEGNSVPIVDTSNVETSVLIEDGKTVMIAGLIKRTDDNQVNKVPGLGDIPAIGSLFRNTAHQKEDKELVIFLTPHIVSGEDHILAMGSSEKTRKPQRVKARKPPKK